MTTLTGHAAIKHAEAHDLLLAKYADPTEDAREGVTPDEAREIASEDPRLIHLEIDGGKGGKEVAGNLPETSKGETRVCVDGLEIPPYNEAVAAAMGS